LGLDLTGEVGVVDEVMIARTIGLPADLSELGFGRPGLLRGG